LAGKEISSLSFIGWWRWFSLFFGWCSFPLWPSLVTRRSGFWSSGAVQVRSWSYLGYPVRLVGVLRLVCGWISCGLVEFVLDPWSDFVMGSGFLAGSFVASSLRRDGSFQSSPWWDVDSGRQFPSWRRRMSPAVLNDEDVDVHSED